MVFMSGHYIWTKILLFQLSLSNNDLFRYRIYDKEHAYGLTQE